MAFSFTLLEFTLGFFPDQSTETNASICGSYASPTKRMNGCLFKRCFIVENKVNLTDKSPFCLQQITDLLDVVLDSFIKTSATGGLGSIKAEVMADTAVALASGNVKLVSSKVSSLYLNCLLHNNFNLHADVALRCFLATRYRQ